MRPFVQGVNAGDGCVVGVTVSGTANCLLAAAALPSVPGTELTFAALQKFVGFQRKSRRVLPKRGDGEL